MLGSKLLILTLSIAGAIGCSRSSTDTYQVRGTVLCDGTAVPLGMVTFVPDGAGKRATGSIGPDGSYEVLAPAGSYKVAIVAVEEVPSQDINKDNWKEAFTSTAPKHYVPQMYSDAETSRLTYTIKPTPENLYDIHISTRSGRRR